MASIPLPFSHMLAASSLDYQQLKRVSGLPPLFLLLGVLVLPSAEYQHAPSSSKGFALLRSHIFPTITLLQKFQTSGYGPGRTCSTVSSGPCLDRESLHPILFLNGLASIQVSGFCFLAVQGGPLLLEQTSLTSRNITSSSRTHFPSKVTQKYSLWHLVLCIFLQHVNAVTAAGTDGKIKHHRMDPSQSSQPLTGSKAHGTLGLILELRR